MIKQILAGALIVGAAFSAHAQSDSTNTSRTNPSTEQKQPSSQFNSKDYTVIQSTDVPASLRTTLQDKNYKGWETGKVYRNNSGNGYWISTGTGTATKNYYFDQNGKAIDSPMGKPSAESGSKPANP